jgi:hypothetical protein
LINVLLIADNVKYYVKIVDKEGKDHTGELIGFEYPSYPALLDEYILPMMRTGKEEISFLEQLH